MQAEIGQFIKSVGGYWGSWLTGGVAIAGIWIYEHYRGQAMPWGLVAVLVVVVFVISAFLSWRDQYRGWATERAYRSTIADQLADLRHTAQKRFYEWWEACTSTTAAAKAKAEAEAVRVQIIEKLTREVSKAEADYFNTPRMFEPFPSERNLKVCPEAVLINEFGYRVQRLGDIIQRLLATSPRGAAGP